MGRKGRQRRVVVTEHTEQDGAAQELGLPVRSEPRDLALAEVWAWCKEDGLRVNKLWPGYSASGRGLHATEGVKRGDLLLQVPAALLFNTRSVRTDKVLGPVLHEAAASGMCQLNPLATLCFGLIHERALGKSSWWWPMLASFPKPEEMVTAEQFTAQELKCVPWAAALHEEHLLQTDNLSTATDQMNSLLTLAIRNEADSPTLRMAQLSSQRGAYSAEGISWAWSVVSTRACFMSVDKYQTKGSRVDTEDTSTLVPWLDLLNHNSAGHAEAAVAQWVDQHRQHGHAGSLGPYEDGVYEVRAGAPVDAGNPVMLCYGDLSNEVLLARYGFVDRMHPADSAVLHPTTGVATLLRIAAKRQYERSAGAVGSAASCTLSKRRKQSSDCRPNAERGKKMRRAAEREVEGVSSCCTLPTPSFCWSMQCASCSCRSATLAEAGLWPLENAGECSFFAPTGPENGALNDAVPVTWNLLTIVRVLAASDTELAGGIKQVISDEVVSKESEQEALAILGDVLTAELQQTTESTEALKLASQLAPAVSAERKAKEQREGLLMALTEAREAVLTGARRAINSSSSDCA